MKNQLALLLVFTFVVVMPIMADDISVSECMKLACGTWVNNEYRNLSEWGKIIQHDNGRRDDYFEATDTEAAKGGGGDIVINKAWTDEEGNIWFTSSFYSGVGYVEGIGPAYLTLNKISESGSVWEFVFSFYSEPTEIDPDAINYRIYSRQE